MTLLYLTLKASRNLEQDYQQGAYNQLLAISDGLIQRTCDQPILKKKSSTKKMVSIWSRTWIIHLVIFGNEYYSSGFHTPPPSLPSVPIYPKFDNFEKKAEITTSGQSVHGVWWVHPTKEPSVGSMIRQWLVRGSSSTCYLVCRPHWQCGLWADEFWMARSQWAPDVNSTWNLH